MNLSSIAERCAGCGGGRPPMGRRRLGAIAILLSLGVAMGASGIPHPGLAAGVPAGSAKTQGDASVEDGKASAGTVSSVASPRSGDGSATIEVDPTDITADSLISRHQAEPRDPNKGPVTNLPLPRYVSLKGGEGNARRGPSLSHRIDWVFRHPGMPLRVVAEFGHWRRVEDQDGAGGWVHYSLLSGVRTAIVITDMAELRARPDGNGSVIARAEAGAIVRLNECNKDWCRVSGGGEKGWVVKTSLWGVDPGEIRD